MTKKKITQGLIQVTERNFDSAPIQDLVQLLGWVQADPGLTSFLQALLAEKTESSYDQLNRLVEKVSGDSLAHSLSDRSKETGSLISHPFTQLSYVRINSSTFEIISGSSLDYIYIYIYMFVC